MRIRSLCLSALAALSVGACMNDPFQPYGTDKAAALRAERATRVVNFDPNVRIKTEEESWPVAWAQMQPREVIKP